MPKADFVEIDRAQVQRFSERPRIAIAAEARYLSQRQPAGLALALARTRDLAASSLVDVDLLVARGRSADMVDLLERAESLGIATVNRRSAIAAVLDKAAMANAFATAGIPTPLARAFASGAPDATTRITQSRRVAAASPQSPRGAARGPAAA